MKELIKRCLIEEGGYLLIESLIALGIFSIGILAFAAMQISASTGNTGSRSMTDLNAMAVDQMERILSRPYASLATSAPASTADGIDNNEDGNIDEAGEPTGRWTIAWTVTNNAVMENSRTVALTVTQHYPGKERSLTLSNIVVLGQN